MSWMKVWLEGNRVVVRKALTHTTAFMAGGSFGCGLGLILMKRFERNVNVKIRERHQLIMNAYSEMDEIGKDITISGEDRERKIEELVAFINLVIEQDLV